MAGIKRIDDERSAVALADLLNGGTRTRPVVVVTTPAGRNDSWIDAEEIAREAGNLAEVFVMPTGSFSRAFSRGMADGTQVYGGAGRVYPVGHEWATDLSKSPLRFAFNATDGERATQELNSDTLRMAAAAGLLQSSPTHTLRPVSGVVKMTIAGRALVNIGNSMPASIAEELSVEGVPIDRLVAVGQRIDGSYDAQTNRISITDSIRPASDALATYAVGDVVLTKVTTVRDDGAELLLYPRTTTPAVQVVVPRGDVTANPYDDLRTLMTVGEVIPARIVAAAPSWALALTDVDDDEPIVDAPSLIAGGPPWLAEDAKDVVAEDPQPLLLPPAPPPMPAPLPEPVMEESPVLAPPAPASRRPDPTMLDRKRQRPAQRPAASPTTAPEPSESTKTLLAKIHGLTAEIGILRREQEDLRNQVLARDDERQHLRYLLDQAGRRANAAENDLKSTRARLRKAGTSKSASQSREGPQFADPEQGFRYLVLTRWATRTLPSEQAGRPLPEYVIGPAFLDSLDSLEGIKKQKVADVVFEIVTGLAPQIPSREVHRLRTGSGGDDQTRVRDGGATAWRASLQVNTPSARRIHYWILPKGQIELARVTTHDDFDP